MSTWGRRAARTWQAARRSPRRSGSSSTAHPGPRSRQGPTGFVADLTGLRHTCVTPEEVLSRLESSLDKDALAPKLLLIHVVRHQSAAPVTVTDPKWRVGKN